MEKFAKGLGVPHPKRLRLVSYPAIKIGRLGLCKDHQGKINEDGSRLSDQLMNFIKGWTVRDHKPAVKFLILDSYNTERNIKFYKRNGFVLLPVPSSPEYQTVPMYFQLDKIIS